MPQVQQNPYKGKSLNVLHFDSTPLKGAGDASEVWLTLWRIYSSSLVTV